MAQQEYSTGAAPSGLSACLGRMRAYAAARVQDEA